MQERLAPAGLLTDADPAAPRGIFWSLSLWEALVGPVFKNLPTGVKLLVLCGTFIASVGVPIYGLVTEKHIAINFARKELVGSRHLVAVRDVYAAVLTPEQGSAGEGHDDAQHDLLEMLTAMQQRAGDPLQLAAVAGALASALRRLWLNEAEYEQVDHLIADALSRTQNFAVRIGDTSNLALDPDLDTYYVQGILVRKLPTLLGRLTDLQHAFQVRGSGRRDDNSVPILIGLVRSVADEIGADLHAAYRGNVDGSLKRAIDADFAIMLSSVDSYVGAVQTAMHGFDVRDTAAHANFHLPSVQATLNSWTVGQTELDRLLRQRIERLLAKMRLDLSLIAAFVGLSIFIAFLTHRHIVRPLQRLETVASKVRQTKDYSIRADYTNGDEIGRVTMAFNDMMSELAAARERETAQRVELARASRLTTMGEMAASIAHEVNQPLSAISSNASAGLRWLAPAAPDLDRVRTVLERVVRDSHRASEVVGSVRSMFKRAPAETAHIHINDIIEEVLTLSRGELRSKRIALRVELARELTPVSASRVQLQQVLMNLIANAVDAMQDASDRPRLLRIRTGAAEGNVLIAVEDSGAGIAPADLERIFDPFFTTKASGMGLGLSVCRSIVEAHGGRLRVSPATPNGTVFEVSLPAIRTHIADAQHG